MIEELRRFILAVEEGNITKTAEKIFITQSALSQSIQRLEKSLGTKLFIQKGKQLHTTPDGIAVTAIGHKILELWENAKNPEIRRSIQQIYTVGMFDNAALLLSDYLQKNIRSDSFHLELLIDRSTKLLSQLQLGIIDIAICVVDKRYPPAKGTILKKVFTENLIPVSSKVFRDPLNDVPFILYNKGSHTRDQIDSVFIDAGIKPKVFAESTSVTFMKELAMLGSGVALLPVNFVQADIKQGLLLKQRMPLTWTRDYGIYVQEHGSLGNDSPILTNIIKTLEKKTGRKKK